MAKLTKNAGVNSPSRSLEETEVGLFKFLSLGEVIPPEAKFGRGSLWKFRGRFWGYYAIAVLEALKLVSIFVLLFAIFRSQPWGTKDDEINAVLLYLLVGFVSFLFQLFMLRKKAGIFKIIVVTLAWFLGPLLVTAYMVNNLDVQGIAAIPLYGVYLLIPFVVGLYVYSTFMLAGRRLRKLVDTVSEECSKESLASKEEWLGKNKGKGVAEYKPHYLANLTEKEVEQENQQFSELWNSKWLGSYKHGDFSISQLRLLSSCAKDKGFTSTFRANLFGLIALVTVLPTFYWAYSVVWKYSAALLFGGAVSISDWFEIIGSFLVVLLWIVIFWGRYVSKRHAKEAFHDARRFEELVRKREAEEEKKQLAENNSTLTGKPASRKQTAISRFRKRLATPFFRLAMRIQG